MKIIANWSRIHGRVEAWRAPDADGAPGELAVRVEHVHPVPRGDGAVYPSLLAGSEGQVLRVRVPATAAARLRVAPGARVVLDARRGRSRHMVFANPERIDFDIA
jgi:hypothetical protein